MNARKIEDVTGKGSNTEKTLPGVRNVYNRKRSGASLAPRINIKKTYRENHPDYVLRNRELQRERNKKRVKEPATILIKSNTLLLQPSEDGTYLVEVKKRNDCK